ncbi:PREDICTED: protein ECT2 isoform X4 [Vollenhovia emeryi]|uniref:protein ECT2 isoform X4 n=1 Tax=Vollenhovia emeryi TaxID=411798 RepID=UPI0005F4C227|nr:PREDICTED: protein ECT2 isoform X4 [Vollenhovia emeryi]
MVVVRRRRRRWLRLCDFGKSRLPSLRRGSGRRSRVTFMLDTRVAVARRTSSRLSLARRLFKFIADGTDECRCTSGTGGHVRRGLRARGTEGLSPGKMEERSVHGSIGDINSAEASKTLIIPRKKRICLVGATCNDPALNAAAQQFKVPVLRSETGTEYVEDTTYNTYFVLKHFEGSEYDALCKSAHRVLGPTVLLQLAEKKESLPSIKRPMYTQAMVGIIVVFSGFRSREDELRKSANMILSMGGSIRKEMGIKVTHLIANHCSGEKYRYADTFGLPIMSLEWVKELWKAKDDISTYANNERLIATYRLKPFYGAKVCFSGFPDEEKKHMREVLEQQGGEPTEIDDPSCTHVVVDIPGLFYKRANNVDLYLKNSPNSPCSLTHIKPISSSLYNPYSNAAFNTQKIDRRNVSVYSSKNNSFASRDAEQSDPWNDLVSIYNISQDSAISMSSDLQNSIIKSGNLFHSFTEQSDSGADITKSSSSSAISISSKYSIPAMSTMTNKKNVKFCTSESSLFDNELSPCETMLNFPDKTSDYKLLSCEKNNECNPFVSPTNNNALSLKYRKNIHYVQNNTSKAKIIPKRYIKWGKTNSCTFVHKMPTLEKYKFMKTRSYPIILKHSEEQHSDTFLHNALVQRNKHLSKSHTSFFSKISHFSFSPKISDKQDIFTSSRCSPPEKTLFKKKYTSLSKSFPTPTKISNSKHSLRNTSISDGKSNNVSSASHDMKTEYTDLETLTDISLPAVVDESSVNVRPSLVSVSAFIVKTGWFWTSVQNEAAADEKEYLFEHYLETVLSPTATGRRDSQQIVPQNVTLAKHPCWLDGPLSNLLQNGADSPASVSGSFLDCTASPDKQLLDEHLPIVQENLSQRHKVFLELVETEGNYVGILNTIMTLFKLPLENLIDKSGKELLNSTEVKIIFGNFPPIYETHNQLLKALHCSAAHWTEDISIGEIFLKFEPDLVKAYPPYVNFFENTKQMLEKCDQDKPRFHAFLKNCQTIPECSRQSLKELLIKPIQRLPSISLLLSDILKHTDKNNPDYSALEASISCIKKVMTYINEDKRKTERQLAMFDIFNEIDNCPPHLVSSHRSFISKCDVMEVTEGLSGRGDHLVLFLFTDTLEICKKRSKAFNSLKSPNTINGLQSMKLSHGKPYKHIKMLSLSTIRKVVDIRETDECHKVFALVVRGTQELKEKFFSFIITDEEVNKTNYLQTLCRQMALAVRVADADTLLIRYDSHQLEVGTSDVASGTLKKTIKFASRTRARVGRAFSFNKTPSKLNRAMSTIMSPFGATQTLPPTNQQIAQMRLGSCNNISELDNGGSSSPNREDVLVAPMSDQPTRKALSMASLRRL